MAEAHGHGAHRFDPRDAWHPGQLEQRGITVRNPRPVGGLGHVRAEGEWLAPVERDGGVHRVRVLRREAPEAPPLTEVRDEVASPTRPMSTGSPPTAT